MKQNLLFVAPDAIEEDCIRVLKQAELYGFVNEQPAGLESMIGEG